MKTILAIACLLLMFCCKQEQPQLTSEELNMKIAENSAAMYDDLVSIRRDIHQHPELAGEEKRTAQLIARELNNLGLEVHENIGGYGVVGILETGKPGKKIAWRADIDALATDFEDPVEFKSTVDGVRHVCGHDVHTTIALGIARNMSKLKSELSGTYYFVFQPAEENITGAKAMLKDGLLDLIEPDEFFALHMTPFPVGTIATKPNEIYAHAKRLEVDMGAQPTSKEIDSVSSFLRSLNNVTDQSFGSEASFEDPVKGIAGSQSIYKDYILPASAIYTDTIDNKIYLRTHYSISNQSQLAQFENELEANLEQPFTLDYETYVVQNDPEITNQALETLSADYPDRIVELSGSFSGSSDDFALFLEQVPGTYFFLGGTNFEKGMISMPHAPDFVVDEQVIETGVTYFTRFMSERASS
jgi:metal-dependent amidase/aminoacylase/carboxypeptidase family protein